MMRTNYLQIMDQIVSVYTPEQIESYISEVENREIWEHGFPRLTANIGILMAYGFHPERKIYFDRMMELCCQQMPVPPSTCKNRGNDFSVREIVLCILELEKSGLYPKSDIDRWKAAMASVNPYETYRMIAPIPPERVDNWAAFNASSEQVRIYAGLAATEDFVENQVASQLLSFDENGMYRDPHEPLVYDVVARTVLSTLLFFGYNGTHKAQLEEYLERAGKHLLHMQSVTGEMPFGGRSNQFLHNEAHLACVFEYEAARHMRKGDLNTAGQFKHAAQLALSNICFWMQNHPGHHVKNLYPLETKVGCEGYAYYNKYMITVASFLYIAYLFCDDSIEEVTCPAAAPGGYTWQTSDYFHKLFCKFGPYYMELETRADPNYDASGIGRIHRAGAPTSICIGNSAAQAPKYVLPAPNPTPLSLCCGIKADNEWHFAWEEGIRYQIQSHQVFQDHCEALWCCQFPCGREVKQCCILEENGVTLSLSGKGDIALSLPAFSFDGENNTVIAAQDHVLTVCYDGWRCTYETDGFLEDLNTACSNRNGVYRIFRAAGYGKLSVQIRIEACK